MKEFKLSAWPDLPPQLHQRTSHRRMLNNLSLRFVSLPQLATSSGASTGEARSLLRELAGRGLLQERDVAEAPAAPGVLRRWWQALRAPWGRRRPLASARARRRA